LHRYDKVARDFRLLEGTAAETSGGLLVAIPKDKSEDFISEFKKNTGNNAWIIGDVRRGDKKAILADKIEVIEV